MNSFEKYETNKILTAKIKAMLKEVREVNTTILNLTAEKNVLLYQLEALKNKFEELNGTKWDKV